MKIQIKKRLLVTFALLPFLLTGSTSSLNAGGKMVYPIKYISKLECRFEKFANLDSNCKVELPILHSKDYEVYSKQHDGFNNFTRTYTVLWAASYKYGWDTGNGGHTGVDIATAEGTPVYAIYDGKVIQAKNMIAWGNTVSIEHTINGKTFISDYAHLSKISVSQGDIVSAGDKIGEVGSTGNAEGNHLHFQIDLVNKFYPYYYNYSACPYSFSKISESDICTSELEKHTLDPLVFLETEGAVLSNIETKIEKVDTRSSIFSSPEEDTGDAFNSAFDENIFNRTIYVGDSATDIKKVQKIFKDLWVYKWDLTGDYHDIIDDITKYQIDSGIISSKTDTGAGYFGPKTRVQVKGDYEKFLKGSVSLGDKQEIIVSRLNKSKKIEKLGLISREEIDKREGQDFIDSYNINFTFDDIGTGINVDQTKTINLTITDKKWRPFKWSMPTAMNFIYDKDLVQVFPNKLYYFTDGTRELSVTWVNTGNAQVVVKIGQVVVKTFNFKVIDANTKIIPESGKIDTDNTTVIWENKTWAMRFKDDKWVDLVNIKYDGEFKISGGNSVNICLKRGTINDLKRVYKKSCSEGDFVKEKTFSYNDTVGWILIFDYKVLGSSGKITVLNLKSKKVLAAKNMFTSAPKWLTKKYVYYDEVIKMIQSWIITNLIRGAFMEHNELTESDALNWIKNTLVFMKSKTQDTLILSKIESRLTMADNEETSKYNTITRGTFLEKTYEYLNFQDHPIKTIEYKDLSGGQNTRVNSVFDKNNTWRDQFGNLYFRPDKYITRGEWAYYLSTLLEKSDTFKTLK